MPYASKADQADAARRHYERNKEAIKARALAHKERHREVLRALIRDAKAVPCVDCGQRFPHYVMDLDHRGDKDCNIADMPRRAVAAQRVMDEMAKCDVVCANCHRERTWKRSRG